MKRYFKYLILAVIGAATVMACEKVQVADVDDPLKPSTETSYDPAKYLTGFSVAQEAVTKADLDFDSGVITWTEGDAVKIVRSDGMSANYSYDANESKFVPEGVEPIEKNGSEMHAFFPADKFTAATGGTVTFTMPEAFETTTGVSNPMAGTVPADATEETVITLRNLGSIYKVNLKTAKESGETVTKLELGNTAVYLTGSALVSFGTDGIPALSGELNGGKAVSITFAEPVRLSSEPKSVYFFLPASGTLTGMYVKAVFGKTVGGVTYEPYEQKTRNSEMTLGRNKLWYMNFSVKGFFSGGDGLSADTAYEIASADDFKAIKAKMESTSDTDGYVSETTDTFFGSEGVFYKQTGNINFNNDNITANMIGTSANPFKGTYDGNGKELQNVIINASANNAGVFGYVDGGTIKKLTVSGSISSTKDNVGAIVGQMASGIITGCFSSATVGGGNAVGGLVGYMDSGTIGSSDGTPTSVEQGTAYAANGCANTGAVTGKQHVGGIVGQMVNGLLSVCRNAGNVTATNTYNAGGIVGYMQGGTMRLCYSRNGITIQAPQQVGGLAGYLSSANSIVIMNCSSKSNVKSTDYNGSYYGAAGGLVGRMYSNANNCVIANSVAWASDVINTSNTGAYVGGIVGWITGKNKKSIVRNCYSQHNGAKGSSNCRVGIKIVDADLTFGSNCGGIFGYLENGEVDDCYWTKHNLVQSAGKETGTAGNKSVTNVTAMTNAAKNGTETITTTQNYLSGRAFGEGLLFSHLENGSYAGPTGEARFNYTGETQEYASR